MAEGENECVHVCVTVNPRDPGGRVRVDEGDCKWSEVGRISLCDCDSGAHVCEA